MQSVKFQYLENFLKYKIYCPPDSTGKDGYIFYNHLFVSNQEIREAIKYVYAFRFSYIKDCELYTLDWNKQEEIRQEEFNSYMNNLLKKKK